MKRKILELCYKTKDELRGFNSCYQGFDLKECRTKQDALEAGERLGRQQGEDAGRKEALIERLELLEDLLCGD